jgi:DNA-binding HxlR family transcriptional regulator
VAVVTLRRGRAIAEPPARRPSIPGDDPEIQRSFRDFRTSAVRLVERVQDALGPNHDPGSEVTTNLRLLRSVFSKWTPEILLTLHAVPSVGFEQLRRSLKGISPRVLSLKLKELEYEGLVTRRIVASRPPRVQYTLTERGWTVTWLSQPVFLYIRVSQPRATGHGAGIPRIVTELPDFPPSFSSDDGADAD